MESKKKALERFVQKKWNPQDYIGYSASFKNNGLLNKPSDNLNQPIPDQRLNTKSYDQDLIRQLGLPVSRNGTPILSDEDIKFLEDESTPYDELPLRGQLIIDLMAEDEEEE